VRAVNLMPRDERRARFDTGRLPLLAAAGGVVVVSALAFFLSSSASGNASDVKAELRAVETAIALAPKGSGGAPVNTGALAQERSDRVAALSAALQSRTAFDRVLREISYVLPRKAWLTKLEATAPGPAVPLEGAAPTPQGGAPAGVTIEGATYTHDAVAKVLARLSVVPSLTNVRLKSTALVEPQADATPEPQPSKPRGKKSKKKKKPTPRPKSFVTFVVTASVRTGGQS
jgi:hypothetical protein